MVTQNDNNEDVAKEDGRNKVQLVMDGQWGKLPVDDGLDLHHKL